MTLVDMRVTILSLISLILLTVGTLEAQGCARCRLAAGWGLASKPTTLFETSAITTIKGDVISVQDVDPDKETVAGEYLLISAEDTQWPVRLGPVSYLKKEGIALEPFDSVEVTGSKIACGDKTGIIATELQHGSKKIRFRDNQGKAVWRD